VTSCIVHRTLQIFGTWACENNQTLATDLKQVIGFEGFVMSDWGGTHSTSIVQGLDVEMPGADFMGATLAALVQNGTIDVSYVDNAVLRILTPMFAVGLFDAFRPDPALNCHNNVSSAAHNALARQFSAASTVLLQNNPPSNAPLASPLLPLDAADPALTLVAVIGLADAATAISRGGGSGEVDPSRVVAPLDALRALLGDARVAFDDGTDLNRASALAARASVAIVFVGATNGREGHDRITLAVDFRLDDLVEHVTAHQPRTIVVVSAPGAVLLPWRDTVPAILHNFIPGQEVGSAIVDVLFGAVNPSGRLPVTLPLTDNDQQLSLAQYPGTPTDVCEAKRDGCATTYSEGGLFGYRYYDAHGLAPMFPFGHGLSYTQFAYADLALTVNASGDCAVRVEFTLQNVGARDGAEVAQVYVTAPPAAGAPPQALKGFRKVQLAAGEKRRVTIELAPRATQVWNDGTLGRGNVGAFDLTSGEAHKGDEMAHGWVRIGGVYAVAVGASSRDHRLGGSFRVPGSAHNGA
jgi:beta-glucosidase